MGKTRKEHVCNFCKKVIPKGTDTSLLVIEADGGRVSRHHSFGSHHGAYSYWGYRKYYHRDCYTIKTMVRRRNKLDDEPFFVQRVGNELIYRFGEEEMVINLGSLSDGIRRDNEVYRFRLTHGLVKHPEIRLDVLQYVDD